MRKNTTLNEEEAPMFIYHIYKRENKENVNRYRIGHSTSIILKALSLSFTQLTNHLNYEYVDFLVSFIRCPTPWVPFKNIHFKLTYPEKINSIY